MEGKIKIIIFPTRVERFFIVQRKSQPKLKNDEFYDASRTNWSVSSLDKKSNE
jgi:hypothetical protein